METINDELTGMYVVWEHGRFAFGKLAARRFGVPHSVWLSARELGHTVRVRLSYFLRGYVGQS
jgi:hypothetical protein